MEMRKPEMQMGKLPSPSRSHLSFLLCRFLLLEICRSYYVEPIFLIRNRLNQLVLLFIVILLHAEKASVVPTIKGYKFQMVNDFLGRTFSA